MRDHSKQVIVDVIEELNLLLAFSLLHNVHCLYRVGEFVSEDSQNVNNLLNATGLHLPDAEQPQLQMPAAASLLSASVHKNFGTPQKRLSVSPIISTHSFYNKLNLNSPLAGYGGQQQPAASLTTNITTATTQLATSATGSFQKGTVFVVVYCRVICGPKEIHSVFIYSAVNLPLFNDLTIFNANFKRKMYCL
jgi:hypothetical protein